MPRVARWAHRDPGTSRVVGPMRGRRMTSYRPDCRVVAKAYVALLGRRLQQRGRCPVQRVIERRGGVTALPAPLVDPSKAAGPIAVPHARRPGASAGRQCLRVPSAPVPKARVPGDVMPCCRARSRRSTHAVLQPSSTIALPVEGTRSRLTTLSRPNCPALRESRRVREFRLQRGTVCAGQCRATLRRASANPEPLADPGETRRCLVFLAPRPKRTPESASGLSLLRLVLGAGLRVAGNGPGRRRMATAAGRGGCG